MISGCNQLVFKYIIILCNGVCVCVLLCVHGGCATAHGHHIAHGARANTQCRLMKNMLSE